RHRPIHGPDLILWVIPIVQRHRCPDSTTDLLEHPATPTSIQGPCTRGSPNRSGGKPRWGLLPLLQPTKSHHLFHLSSRFRQLHVVDPTPDGCRLYPSYGRNALRGEKGSPHTS